VIPNFVPDLFSVMVGKLRCGPWFGDRKDRMHGYAAKNNKEQTLLDQEEIF
jgi:hypothetical protein